MRAGWLVLAAMGCTEADLDLVEVLAADDVLAETALRTRVYRVGEGRLTPDGPPLETEHPGYLSGDSVVVEVAERVRIVHESREARMLIWVDPEDLGTWVIDGTRGGARPGFSGGEDGVWLDGAHEVEVDDRDGGWAAIHVETYDWVVDTWVPGFDIGPYWVERGPAPGWDGPADVFLRDGTEVRDRRGDVLATVADFGDPEHRVAYRAATVIERDGARLRIESGSDGVTVVGWVDEADVSDRAEGGRGFTGGCGGCGGIGGWGVWPNMVLPAGTPFYAEPDGELVGETLEERGWPIGETVDGWTATRVLTPWGSGRVWVW